MFIIGGGVKALQSIYINLKLFTVLLVTVLHIY